VCARLGDAAGMARTFAAKLTLQDTDSALTSVHFDNLFKLYMYYISAFEF
jgi:hypothetical protein